MSASPSLSADFLPLFESRLRDALQSPRHQDREPRILLEACRHLSFAGGAKRMRPLLVDHFGAAIGVDLPLRLTIAAVAELVHTASLLHDDIIDEGTLRRGVPTVNAQWDNSVAVLGGDLMLCIALEQLEGLPHRLVFDTVDLVAEMTRAAMLEVQARADGGWSLDDWEIIADGKTGSLLAWCGRAIALAADHPEQSDSFARCGRHLGLAFQITDDLIDLLSTSGEAGKDRLADLRHKNPSFPVALARTQCSPLRNALDEIWSEDMLNRARLDEIAAQIVELEIPTATLERIEAHLNQALDALGDFAHRPGGDAIVTWAAQLRAIARQTLESS